MPPTSDTSPVRFGAVPAKRKQESTKYHQNTMRTVSMMAGDQTNGFTEEENKYAKFDYFYKEPCFYTHKMFSDAAKVFSALRHDSVSEADNLYLKKRNSFGQTRKVVLPELEIEDDTEKRLTFELAFETLKYQRVFEDLLQECSFFSHFPECVEDESLVMVVLWDYQNRKFQVRTPLPGETQDAIVQQVEDAVIEYKVKLNASLARHRIKASAPSLEFLLPDKVRSKEEIRSKLPVYVWVNSLKTSLDGVISRFKGDRHTLIEADQELSENQFYVDCHCTDMLVFPAESREYILQHPLLLEGHIVMQDKSSCIAPQSVKYLMGDDDDIIHINAGSGVTTAHLASLMCNSSGHIWAFGANKNGSFQKQAEKFGVKNVKILPESFEDIDVDDSRFKNVKVVLVTADCSKSGITNPIDFIVSEGEDMKILKDLSVGETDMGRLGDLVTAHNNILKHAMKLHKVQAVVYMTRSIYEAENEAVVTRAIEYCNMVQQRKFPYRVVPPVIPFTGHDIENSIGICGKYIKFPPSEKNSGCFVAVITREPEDAKEATKDVLARAQAKGLLGGKKKEPKERKVENGDVQENEDEKLLQRRVKKQPRKLRPVASAPHAGLPVYHKPSGSSIIKSQIYSTPKLPQRSTKSIASIGSHSLSRSKTRLETQEKKDKPKLVAEHVKVVKHPAPFSHFKPEGLGPSVSPSKEEQGNS